MKERNKRYLRDGEKRVFSAKAGESLCFTRRCHTPKSVVIIVTMLLVFVCYGHGDAGPLTFKRTAKERTVAALDRSTLIQESFAVSPDGRRVAYVEKVGDRRAVVVDGVRQKVYDEIVVPGFGLDWSADSARIGYFARENKDWFLVIDGKEEREHRPNIRSHLILGEVVYFGGYLGYSEEGAHYCYTADDAGKQYLVVDGKAAGNKYVQVFACQFSHDGKRIAYSARERPEGNIFYVIDGVKQKEYGIASHFTFSPDGQRFAYLAYPTKAWTQRGQRKFVVLDGREDKEHDRASSVLFSPDSKRTAYIHVPESTLMPQSVIVLDGREIADERAGLSTPVFSPDSKRFAHEAGVVQARTLFTPNPPPPFEYNVIDGKPGKHYDGVSIPVFSPDSRRVAYYGRVGDVLKKHYFMIVIDNEEGKPYDHVGHPVFSPDSRRVGYQARQGSDRFIVVDGKEHDKYESVSNPLFAPDSRRVSYVAKKSGKVTVVIDDAEGQFYDEIYPRHWRKRVADTGIGFSSADSFYYFAKKGNELIFVQETIEPLPAVSSPIMNLVVCVSRESGPRSLWE